MSIKNVSGPVIIVQSEIVRVQSHENAMIACWLLSRRGGAVACLLAYLDVSKLWPPNFLSDLSPLASYALLLAGLGYCVAEQQAVSQL